MKITIITAALLAACTGTEQAPTVELPVTTAAATLPNAATDLGYSVQVTRMRVAVTEIQFTIDGELHDVARVVGPAPHPGHSGGGEVTGELAGDHVLRWDGQAAPALGTGQLLAGDYRGANFTLRAATASDVDAADPLLGHAFHVAGTVTKAGETRSFDMLLDVEPDTIVIGAPFAARLDETTTSELAFIFTPTDPNEQDTAFDGVDFFALPMTGGSIAIRPGSDAHNIIRRAIQTHDHYGVIAR